MTQAEFPLLKARQVLEKETIAVLGYGSQGQGQGLNLRDNGLKVIIGQREGSDSWDKALADGWVAGKTLFTLEEATKRGSFILYLLSDAGQKAFWPKLRKYLNKEKTLCFAHGFSIVYKDLTGVIPPKDTDVILIAPKGSGLTVRRRFLEGLGTSASYAVHQDATGTAEKKTKALGMLIGSSYLFPTTFKREVYCNLTSERGVLVGALTGVMEAQYNILRKHGHTPSEAFTDTVEQLTQSLIQLVGEHGMDWLFANISTTAQRGALDWKGKFKKAAAPVFSELYKKVADGTEAARVIEQNSKSDYRAKLNKELEKMAKSEMWRAGKEIRKLRHI